MFRQKQRVAQWSGGTAEKQTDNLNNSNSAIESDILQLKAHNVNNQLGATPASTLISLPQPINLITIQTR